jgi:hypothetical protein
MTLEVEFWTLVSVCFTFAVTVGGVVWGLMRGVLGQAMKRIEDHLAALDKAQAVVEQYRRDEDAQLQRIEREFRDSKADLPINYVRRDEFIRHQQSVEAKLDALMSRLGCQQSSTAAPGQRGAGS